MTAVTAQFDGTRELWPLEPTDETSPKRHHYALGALRDGVFTGLVEIELTDFRGGAILYPGAADTDSAQLYAQLPESDSIFVVVGHDLQATRRARRDSAECARSPARGVRPGAQVRVLPGQHR